ncbi:MAG: MOSC domain-containing protein [Burkholderiales bacterium]|nr:MOSC domain-containing protein [Burkholderiales bacterium]
MWEGHLLHICVAEQTSVEMEELVEAKLIAGVGIEGDRYATGMGRFSYKFDKSREVTLIEIETLQAIQRDAGIELLPQESRRNLTTRGVPLNHLVGKEFCVGESVLFGDRLNRPCKYLDELLDRPLFNLLLNRSGLNCSIVKGGIVRRGDIIRPSW